MWSGPKSTLLLWFGLLMLMKLSQAEEKQPPPKPDEYAEGYAKETPKPPDNPGNQYSSECKYDDAPFTDCDPFHLVRWRTMKLITGGSSCESYKNETQQCSSDHFPPGTRWLVKEHKKCLSEMEHLKSLLAELNRWIDLIHERGQALFSAFNELRKHLEDVQRQIKDLHRESHNYQVMMDRLKKELEEWKVKSRKLRTEVDSLKAKYAQLEREHGVMKEEYDHCQRDKEACKKEADNLNEKISQLTNGNRDLKTRLLHAERYKEMVEKAVERIKELEETIEKLKKEIYDTKAEYQKCRVDLLNAKNKKGPKFNKDTHVNLDMQMWITHNKTKEEPYYAPPSTEKPPYKATKRTTPYAPPAYSTSSYKKSQYTTSTRKDVPA